MDFLLTDMDLVEAQRKRKRIQSESFPCPAFDSRRAFEDVNILPRFPCLSHGFRPCAHARAIHKSAGRARRKNLSRRQLTKKLKQIRYVDKIKKANMDPEQKILDRIERAKKSIQLTEERLKKYSLPSVSIVEHDPEPLTAEEIQYLKKMARKNKNYVPVGRRGVFGGVVQNMHLHWKKHQTVNIWCRNFSKEEVLDTADELTILSGGIVVGIEDEDTIAMYRGRNYTQPIDIIPKNTLSKRKALQKSLCLQALNSFRSNLQRAEERLKQYHECIAQAAETIAPTTNDNFKPVVADKHKFYFSESDSFSDLDIDPVPVSDSEYESEHESSARAGLMTEDSDATSASDFDFDSFSE